ncbi:hypothetical protein AVEN_274057-1 [Araneus ventricosus]|uniref:Uncharacterized protein n=1 Tax=Araneus ventricosus TaxID=182803 RepID=A0A4Y2MG37_ARAVE|nr:hypothetical protein AVEN_274057-1 [Araneus ventricosus]
MGISAYTYKQSSSERRSFFHSTTKEQYAGEEEEPQHVELSFRLAMGRKSPAAATGPDRTERELGEAHKTNFAGCARMPALGRGFHSKRKNDPIMLKIAKR